MSEARMRRVLARIALARHADNCENKSRPIYGCACYHPAKWAAVVLGYNLPHEQSNYEEERLRSEAREWPRWHRGPMTPNGEAHAFDKDGSSFCDRFLLHPEGEPLLAEAVSKRPKKFCRLCNDRLKRWETEVG